MQVFAVREDKLGDAPDRVALERVSKHVAMCHGSLINARVPHHNTFYGNVAMEPIGLLGGTQMEDRGFGRG